VQVKSLRRKIGYPEYILKRKELAAKYADLSFSELGFFGNMLTFDLWDIQSNLAKITKPVDFGEWDMTPATVNVL
jgi:predicted metalloendopeptidase